MLPATSDRPTDSTSAVLPFWQRLLLATMAPNGLFFGAAVIYLTSQDPPGSSAGSVPNINIDEIVWTFLVLYFFPLPIVVCTFYMSLRLWQRWYTALAGGLAGLLAGTLIGAAGLLLLKTLSD